MNQTVKKRKKYIYTPTHIYIYKTANNKNPEERPSTPNPLAFHQSQVLSFPAGKGRRDERGRREQRAPPAGASRRQGKQILTPPASATDVRRPTQAARWIRWISTLWF